MYVCSVPYFPLTFPEIVGGSGASGSRFPKANIAPMSLFDDVPIYIVPSEPMHGDELILSLQIIPLLHRSVPSEFTAIISPPFVSS